GNYWSSTTSVSGPSSAWFVGFLFANVDAFSLSGGKSGTASVRAVRGASTSGTTTTSTSTTTTSTTQAPTTTTSSTTTTTQPPTTTTATSTPSTTTTTQPSTTTSSTTTSRTTTTTTKIACGDVNGDGVVNIADALLTAQYDVDLRTCGQAPFSHPEVCDVNSD